MHKHIKWAPMIPLIGGFPLGAEKAIQNQPSAIVSYSAFAQNDNHYVTYQNETLSRDIDYVWLDEQPDYQNEFDIVVGTPPCAGLSMLNTGKTRGAGCPMNDWMYQVAVESIDRFNAKVIVIENAPGLYTNAGKGVRQNLIEIAQSRGYSVSFVKTNTVLHGIPQNRLRTFAFLWKSETSPIIQWEAMERPTLQDYVDEMLYDMTQCEEINPKLASEPLYRFLNHHTDGQARKVMIDSRCRTVYNYIKKKDLFDEALKWFEEINDERGIKFIKRCQYKHSINKGIWDNSVHIGIDNTINAWIGRNMSDTLHPTKERSFTIGESLHMMGFPNDFQLQGGRSNTNHIAQNVPVNTATWATQQAILFICGELEDSGLNMMMQDNIKQKFTTKPKEETIELF